LSRVRYGGGTSNPATRDHSTLWVQQQPGMGAWPCRQMDRRVAECTLTTAGGMEAMVRRVRTTGPSGLQPSGHADGITRPICAPSGTRPTQLPATPSRRSIDALV